MLLILGLDGATLDLVEPWVAAGTLPNIARLMDEGAWGQLAATMPPATFPSWTTFMTGVNPGRHGIFDFTRRQEGSYRVRFVNSTFRKAPTVWRILSDAGLRVTVLGLPGTYPPEPINGYMVSGFDTPVTTRADATFCHPPELADEIEKHGGFPFADFQEFEIGPGWHQRALDSLRAAIGRKTDLALALLEHESWDCFMLMFGESDTVAHHFWSLHDPRSPRYDARLAAELGDGIHHVYRALDAAIGRLRDRYPDADLLIASDHGFGGVGSVGLRINRWLCEQGLLSFHQSSAATSAAGWLRAAALKMIPERWQARLFRLGGGRLAGELESRVRFGAIDWRGTRAFSEELNYFPSIWLNVRGREPGGTVEPGDYDAVCAEVGDRLLSWRDSSNRPVVRRVWRRDEIYDGPQVEAAPDLILELETPGDYSYVCLSSLGRPGQALCELSGEELAGGKLAGMSGSHRRQGLFFAVGPGVPRRQLGGVQMADMAPTILLLCGLDPAASMEGRSLAAGGTEFTEISLESQAPVEQYYNVAEEEAIRRRLEQLGYLS